MTHMDAGLRRGDANLIEPAIIDHPITAASAWCRDDLRDEDWKVSISDAALGEMDALVQRLKDHQGPVEALRPEAFSMPATAEVMAGVRARLESGVGFAVLDRLLVDRWGEAASKALAWLAASHLGPVVMQKHDGTRLYEVVDTGKPLGHGVRRSVTNLDQEFHTDGGWVRQAPRTVSLACLRQAQAGGTSRVVSLVTAHNVLRERHPELLARLYHPFWWDRQAEHGPDEPLCCRHPVYASSGGNLIVRYYDDYVRKGHQLAQEPLDEAGEASLDAMAAVIKAPENSIEFRLERGQVEYANNHLIAHARTAFEDKGPIGSGRFLLRLWGRSSGGIGFEDDAGTGG